MGEPCVVVRVAGGRPKALGGPIADGTYVLVGVIEYTGEGVTSVPDARAVRSTLVIRGARARGVTQHDRDAPASADGMLATDGARFLLSEFGGANAALLGTYTVEGDELRFFTRGAEGTVATIYRRRVIRYA